MPKQWQFIYCIKITYSINFHPTTVCSSKCLALAEIGDRLATIDMGRKWERGLCLLSGGARAPSNTMPAGPRPTSVPSGILIHPTILQQQTWVENLGGLCPFFWGGLVPHLTQCGLGKWYLDPSSCLATIEMGQKCGLLCPFLGRVSWILI